MGVRENRENKVETHLNGRVVTIGGLTRKWVSPGHVGVPDRIVIYQGFVFFVEVKTIDGRYEPGQQREHDRLREKGAIVCTVYGDEGVTGLIDDLTRFGRPMAKYY